MRLTFLKLHNVLKPHQAVVPRLQFFSKAVVISTNYDDVFMQVTLRSAKKTSKEWFPHLWQLSRK